MFGREVMMTDGMPNGYMVDMFESADVEPVVSVEESGKTAQEDEEHTEGDEHTEEDEHMEDEHAHSGFMVKVPVTHDIYAMSFTVTEDMIGEWEIGCFLLDGVHYNSGMVGTLTVEK
jgi:ABC-type Zn2+ transport system substrate-binding protein/surface adhesin